MAKKEYDTAMVAIDPVIFTIHDKKLKVLLSVREKEPYDKKHELPGGLLLPDENAEETLKRKLRELLGGASIFFTQFYTFTSPSRDIRGRTISIGFIALVSEDKIKPASNWHDCNNLPELAFDHRIIIGKAKAYLKNNINSLIVKQFMPALFPLNKLQDAYEVIEEKRYDNRNFRKRMISLGIVEETGKAEQNVSHRPANLFRFKANT